MFADLMIFGAPTLSQAHPVFHHGGNEAKAGLRHPIGAGSSREKEGRAKRGSPPGPRPSTRPPPNRAFASSFPIH
jgi:hypothetical protein